MNDKNIEKFKVLISSDLDYEKMVTDLFFGNNRVATLSCDDGIDKAKIEIIDRFENKIIWNLDYKKFINALILAYEQLQKVNEEFETQ